MLTVNKFKLPIVSLAYNDRLETVRFISIVHNIIQERFYLLSLPAIATLVTWDDKFTLNLTNEFIFKRYLF